MNFKYSLIATQIKSDCCSISKQTLDEGVQGSLDKVFIRFLRGGESGVTS